MTFYYYGTNNIKNCLLLKQSVCDFNTNKLILTPSWIGFSFNSITLVSMVIPPLGVPTHPSFPPNFWHYFTILMSSMVSMYIGYIAFSHVPDEADSASSWQKLVCVKNTYTLFQQHTYLNILDLNKVRNLHCRIKMIYITFNSFKSMFLYVIQTYISVWIVRLRCNSEG